MVEFEHRVFINRPLEEVFDFVSNPENDSQWIGPVESAWFASDGPVGAGSIVSSKAKFMGRSMESDSEVTVWDPPTKFGMKSAGGPVPYEQTITFTPKENGTQMDVRGHADIGGFFKLAEGLVGKQLNKQMKNDLNTLKSLLESG